MPGVVVPEEAEARALHAARRGGGLDPAAQAIPGRVAGQQRARDRVVRDPRAREGARQLGHAAGRAVREPLARRHRLVVETARGLQVEDHDRHLRGLHRGQHLRRGRVGRRVEHDDVDAARGQQVAGLARALGGVDETGRDDLRPELGESAPRRRADSRGGARAGPRTAASRPPGRCRRVRPAGARGS